MENWRSSLRHPKQTGTSSGTTLGRTSPRAGRCKGRGPCLLSCSMIICAPSPASKHEHRQLFSPTQEAEECLQGAPSGMAAGPVSSALLLLVWKPSAITGTAGTLKTSKIGVKPSSGSCKSPKHVSSFLATRPTISPSTRSNSARQSALPAPSTLQEGNSPAPAPRRTERGWGSAKNSDFVIFQAWDSVEDAG